MLSSVLKAIADFFVTFLMSKQKRMTEILLQKPFYIIFSSTNMKI